MVLMVGAVFCVQFFLYCVEEKENILAVARSKNVFEVMLMSSSELNISQVVWVFFFWFFIVGFKSSIFSA